MKSSKLFISKPFKAFLSHKYTASAVNLYFFNVFKEIAEVQFEVDEGTYSTSVTRLERMIRDCDAFIGIYPYDELNIEKKQLLDNSKYFRLEIDLAIRSNKPSIIFYDKRYSTILKPPQNIFSIAFDMNEIISPGGYPSINQHKNEFRIFCETVFKTKEINNILYNKNKDKVAVLLPNENKVVEKKVVHLLEENNYSEIEILDCTTILSIKTFRILENIDFAIIDHCESISKTGIHALFHGRFIPMIRTYFQETNQIENDLICNFLYGGVEVGYTKDMLFWKNPEDLLNSLIKKIERINNPVRRISTFEEAENYFTSASLRKDVVFVSYSGNDIDVAKDIIKELKQRFQTVFDYKDGISITPGKPWLSEIFDNLSKSAIGISLFSKSYFESGNCRHELEEMIALLDNGKISFFPIKLYSEKISTPSYLNSTQYYRRDEYPTLKALVNDICEKIKK